MKKYILLAILSACGLSVYAQGEFDALRLSQTDIIGTARYVSMSGAFGALGGDMSALSLNPAGIGIYRSSELSFSPSFQENITTADFNGSVREASKVNVLMNGFGYVGSFRTYDESAISNFNFAVSYSRVADFNKSTNIVGVNRSTSLLDRICEVENGMWYDNGTHPNHTPFYEYVNGVHVVGLNSTADSYVSQLSDGEKLNNSMELLETGGINAWNFTLGANYNHSLYVGIGVGLQQISYNRSSTYVEEYELGGGTDLRNALSTTGSGIDFKVGLIYRPVPELRLGFSYNTGTYYTLTDVFNASMASWGFIDPNTNLEYSPEPKHIGNEQYVDYRLTTPWKMTFSAAYQFETKGLLSVDFDYVDNKNMTLKNASGFEMTDINDYIDFDFKKSYNIRIGGELRVTDNLSVRLGGAYYMTPLISNLETYDIATAYTRPEYTMPMGTLFVSGGIGYRSGAFFTDVALQERLSDEHFYNFCDMSLITEPKYASLKRDRMNLVITAGIKF